MMKMQIVWHIPRDSDSDCVGQYPAVLMLLALGFETLKIFVLNFHAHKCTQTKGVLVLCFSPT